MPESTLKWQSFNQKKPYLIATVFSMAAVVGAIGMLFGKLADTKTEQQQQVHAEVEPAQNRAQRLERALGDRAKAQKEADQIITWMDARLYWSQILSELRGSLVKVEGTLNRNLNVPTGIWIDQFITVEPRTDDLSAAGAAPTESASNAEATRAAQMAFMKRYGLRPTTPQPEQPPAAAPDATAGAETPRKKKGDTNEISSITITFRAVGLNSTDPNADKTIYYGVLSELQNNPLFDKDDTQGDGNIGTEEPLTGSTWPGTFTFKITVGLKRPLKL